MHRKISVIAALIGALLIAAPVAAITNGVPDAQEHKYVGEVLFYVPDAVDSRFDDPGSWYICSGTLLSSTIVVTAGHCTFGVGNDGVSTTHGGVDTTAAQGGSGGNDIWVNFNEVPDFSILPPSSTFARNQNPQRYAAWVAALTAHSADWHRGKAYPHPQYDDNAFFVHDAGVVQLIAPDAMAKFGKLAGPHYLDRYRSTPRNAQRFETVGYGLEGVQGKKEFGGDTRRKSEPKLDSLKSHPAETYIVISNNTATGGVCFGDSGGPTFDNTNSSLVVAVTSWGGRGCGGKSGAYRLDEPDDQAFLLTFGIHPSS